MCGIVGIHSSKPVAAELHDSLVHLQHRGQDACGILTAAGRFYLKAGKGYVREVFSAADISSLRGNTGIAHVRYPTAGGNDPSDIQPLWTGSPRGIALAHNGNLINYPELAREMSERKHFHLNSSTDSEVLLHLLAEGLADRAGSASENEEDVFDRLCEGVRYVFSKARGSFSVISQVMGQGLLVFRDPHGIRPLVCGRRTNADGGNDYIFASETTPFLALGFKALGDVANGEVVFVSCSGRLFRRVIESATFSPCIFEYVYFARPDSELDGVSVYEARVLMGEKLARQWQQTYPSDPPDVVVPAPFTSNTAAIAFAGVLGLRYAEGLYKNPFIGRTFIMPDGAERQRNVRYKLIPQKSELFGRRVLVLDDSIVRGTTSREIVRIIRGAGAIAVDFVSACPPVKYPCFYGIDLPSQGELIAANQSVDDVCAWLGADRLLYQSETDLFDAVSAASPQQLQNPCMACLNGCYVTGNISAAEQQSLEQARNRRA